MSWLVENQDNNPSLILKKLLKEQDTIVAIGVYNPIVGLIAREVGFRCLYLSGAALSASLGLPDLSLIELNEVASMTRYIYRACSLPMIVDVDVGFGESLNVAKTAKEMFESKAAAIQIEDQKLPKRCGHLSGKELIDAHHMEEKIKAAKKSAKDLLVVARTDARSVDGLDEAIFRAKIYEKAGADIIFPEALESKDEFLAFSKAINVPLMANMTEFGKTPYISVDEFRELGYKIVIFPVSALRIANKAIKEVFEFIKISGSQKNVLDRMQTREELYRLIRYFEYEKLDKNVFLSIDE
ncbi:MAG: methylisocitrate lyase [Desulfurella sp.]|uniref:methylisocitrate lyase n=1 Tax=Desulfurella sp. TaxID=1962857 RepID=UPI003CC44296